MIYVLKLEQELIKALRLLHQLHHHDPDTYYSPNQYANEANFMGHYKGTGPEIWKQTDGKVTHFFTGVGTGGTITGIGNLSKGKKSRY